MTVWLSVSAPLQAKPIDVAEAVTIGNIKQWIQIRGAQDTLPVLLFLHGGPGNSVMGYAEKFTRKLQRHFVVVQWDQRESGKTARLNSSPVPVSVSVMESDASEMVDYLRKRFGRDKIFIVGHSWGGFLALRVADLHPEWLSACVAVAPMIQQWESERQTLAWLQEKATQGNKEEAIRELSQVKVPFQAPDELYLHRKWLAIFAGKDPVSRAYVLKWSEKWFALYREACGINLFETLPKLHCPVYFFVGREDRQASSTITEAYYRSVMAQKKELIWFTNSGHSLNLTEPIKFQDTLIGLLPN
ncbi:MAG: alpha/beta hydrolase [Cyclobacteriaceae bacterium]|nr:alpha/beta hydrolase [Cyclobacteriaceae bacterium]